MDPVARFVALGDSQTEGLGDLDEHGRPRGWADRLAERLDAHHPGLLYANLAVRGCRARHVYDVQLPVALAMRPDLATVAVGMNDVLRHDFELESTVAHVERTILALQQAGARVATMSFPDIGRVLPVLRWLVPRQRLLNDRLRVVAARHGVPLLELADLDLNSDWRMWSRDRIHGSPTGHARIAEGMAELLGLPADPDWWRRTPGRPLGPLAPWATAARDARWLGTFLVPFLVRQARGRMSPPVAKRPALAPVREALTTP